MLDDFHLLGAPGLVEGVARWTDALPPRAHLAILSRVLPDLPLARWRAQGRLAELGTDDLRFSLPELRALLVDLHGLQLSDASLHVVAAKTEGWPAGIVLALHAARAKGAAAAAQVLGSLSGSTHEIYEYLAQEAFARQRSAAASTTRRRWPGRRGSKSWRDDWTYLGCIRYQANFFWALGRFREAEGENPRPDLDGAPGGT